MKGHRKSAHITCEILWFKKVSDYVLEEILGLCAHLHAIICQFITEFYGVHHFDTFFKFHI